MTVDKSAAGAEYSIKTLLSRNKQLEQQVQALTQQALLTTNHPEQLSVQIRTVLDNIPIRIFWKDRNSVYLGANVAFLADAGLTDINDIIGKTDFDLPWTSAEAQAFRQDDQQVIANGVAKVNIEEPQTRADGITGWLRTNKIPLRGDDGKVYGVLGTYEDITKHKQQEINLRDSEARFKSLFNQTYQFLGLVSLDGVLLTVNDTVANRFDLHKNDIENHYFPDTPFWAHNLGERTKIINAISEAKNGHFARFNTFHPLADGSLINVDFSIKPITDATGKVEMLLAEGRDITEATHNHQKLIASRQSLQQAEQELRKLNETLEQRVLERTQLLEKSNQEQLKTLEELQLTQDELVESKKLASLGSLVAGVAHEVNTPLGVAITSSSMLGESIRALRESMENNTLTKSELERYFDKTEEIDKLILANLDQCVTLIQGFKQVSVDQVVTNNRELKIKDYIKQVMVTLSVILKRNHIQWRVTGDNQSHTLDAGVLAQVITNLANNAIVHAFNNEQLTQRTIDISIEAQPEQSIILFTDNGVGMDEVTRQKIFEPFFTTRRGKGGTGLGMHIVRNLIIAKMHGSIEITSQIGKGTSAKIVLPTLSVQPS